MSANRFLAALAASAAVSFGAAAAKAEGLVAFEVVDESSIPASLTGEAGDAEKGKAVFTSRKLGNCLACHQVTALMEEQQFHGDVGPSLDGVADRYTAGELRLQIVNPKIINPETMMPAFYRVDGLNRVAKAFEGKPILTAQQVEDLLAYVQTLTEE